MANQNTSGSKGNDKVKKTACPVSLAQFLMGAAPIEVIIAGRRYTAQPKKFSTGSFGYNLNEKVELTVDSEDGEEYVKFQINMNITAIASKEAPRE